MSAEYRVTQGGVPLPGTYADEQTADYAAMLRPGTVRVEQRTSSMDTWHDTQTRFTCED